LKGHNMATDTDFAKYDEVHVISDLHMGGDKPDFQILRETKRLAGFIRWVSEQAPNGNVALVLNGDVIDTLAEEVGGYIATANAVSTLQRIMNDASFEPVFSALADFVKKPKRTLVVVIGNHDIELALPVVQHTIIARIAGDDAAARGRIEFATVGAGYSCIVGNARVFCIHGNEVDPWNFVRYEDLSKLARRLNAGRALDSSEWEPNAGTRMVKDVMNDIKRRYAWIDLLKPEDHAAVGVLLVLDPGQITKIGRLPGVATEFATGALEFQGRLGGAPAGTPSTAAPLTRTTAEALVAASSEMRPVAIDQLLGANLTQGLKLGVANTQEPADRIVQNMLAEAEANYSTSSINVSGGAATGVQRAMEDQTLGMLGLPRLMLDRLTGWITGVGKGEALRRALQDWLANDKTFDSSEPDYTFKQVTKVVGTGIDFVVTGHTHLHKAIDMGGGRYYFNTGTWIRLLRFTPEMLKDANSFDPVMKVLEDGRLTAIDGANFAGQQFVLDRTSTVRIQAGADGVTGSLAEVVGAGPTSDAIKVNTIKSLRRI
jgi:UDP-2,3-diacylglucosamine pyrophosphatase LpxH